MTPETEKRLRKWLSADHSRKIEVEWMPESKWAIWCKHFMPCCGHTLNAAVRRFLDAAEVKDGK